LEKNRLDMLLVEQGLAPSREKARGMILAGQVRVNGRVLDKPGTSVAVDSIIELAGKTCPYVSRGGLKIEKAGEVFGVDFKGRVVLDVGASTGGYTDYALQKGAARVYAVDVGYGQLDWKLRNDPRVVNLERTNIRYLERLDEPVDIVSIDVSFISTSKVFPAIRPMLKDNGLVISLIKPQFEAGRNQVGKKGVVRDPGCIGRF
jgi:hemolysin TlyA family protein